MIPLLDTHQHLVYRDQVSYGWIKDYPPIHEDSFTIDDYRTITEDLGKGLSEWIAVTRKILDKLSNDEAIANGTAQTVYKVGF